MINLNERDPWKTLRQPPRALWSLLPWAWLACSSRSSPDASLTPGHTPMASDSALPSTATSAPPSPTAPASSASASAPSPARFGAPEPVGSSAPEPLRAACEAARARAEAATQATSEPLAPGSSGPYGRCWQAGRGAWLLDIERQPGAPGRPDDDPRVWPSFVTPDGQLVQAARPLPLQRDQPTNQRVSPDLIGPLTDWDEDGSVDLLLGLEWTDLKHSIGVPGRHTLHGFALHGKRIDELTPPAFVRKHLAYARDADGDGRVDFLLHLRWQHPDAQRRCFWPDEYSAFSSKLELLAHNTGHGKFRLDDEVARAHTRQHSCPWPLDAPLLDNRDGASEQRIRCARLLGQPAADVAARVRQEHARLPARDRFGQEPEKCLPLAGLLKAAAWQPEQALTGP